MVGPQGSRPPLPVLMEQRLPLVAITEYCIQEPHLLRGTPESCNLAPPHATEPGRAASAGSEGMAAGKTPRPTQLSPAALPAFRHRKGSQGP